MVKKLKGMLSTRKYADPPGDGPYPAASPRARLLDSTYRVGYSGGKLDGMKSGLGYGLWMGVPLGFLLAGLTGVIS